MANVTDEDDDIFFTKREIRRWRGWSYQTFLLFSTFFLGWGWWWEWRKCLFKKKIKNAKRNKKNSFDVLITTSRRDPCRWSGGLSDVIDQFSRVRSICPINTNGFESPHYFRGNIYGGGQTLSIKSGRKVHIPSLLTFDLIFHFPFELLTCQSNLKKRVTDRFGKAAVIDSLLLRNLSPSMLVEWAAAELDDGPLVVDDWRRIQGKLPKAISTRDSRRPVAALFDLELFPEPIPPVKKRNKNWARNSKFKS